MAGYNYGDALTNMLNQPNLGGLSTPTLEEAQQQAAKQRTDIDIFAKQFAPVAETESGRAALRTLMGDQNADKIQRAAAIEVMNPGVQAGIGGSGEMSFSAKPGSDAGYKSPVFSQQTTAQQASGQVMQQQNSLSNFEQQFRDIQTMEDPAKIAEAYSAMTAAAATTMESRRKQLLSKVGAGMGLQALESQMAADKVADSAFYNQYYNGQNLGPTDESMRNISLYNSARARADAEVDRQLRSDPVISRMESQLKTMGMLVDSKLRKNFSGEANEKAAMTALVGEDSIKAVALARGLDYGKMTTIDKELISSQLVSGQNNATAQSRDIALADTNSVAIMAAGPASEHATQARRVLESRAEDPAVVDKILTTYRDFDKGLGANLTKEQKESLRLDPMITGEKEKAVARNRIESLKMGMAIGAVKTLRDQGFANNAQAWELPQDQSIAEDFKSVRDAIQATNPPNGEIRIDQIIQQMDWTGENQQARIDALSAYVQSQAKLLPGNKFFGVPTLYSNPDMARRYVQTLAVQARVNSNINAAPGAFGTTLYW